MKIEINDEAGSSVIAVLKLDGSPAVEGVDFALWEGKYHKNGKWSYTEGGVALKEGIVVFNQRSTHSSANHRRRAYIIGTPVGATTPCSADYAPHIMGKFSGTPERPVDQDGYFGDAFEPVLQAILAWGRKRCSSPVVVEEMIASWKAIEKFI